MVWPCRQNARQSTTETAAVRSNESGQVRSWGEGRRNASRIASALTPESRLPWTAQPDMAASQRIFLHQRRDAQQKLRERKARATFTSTAAPTHVSHMWACLSRLDRPHQPSPDPHSQIFHLTLTSWSSSTPKDKHKEKKKKRKASILFVFIFRILYIPLHSIATKSKLGCYFVSEPL